MLPESFTMKRLLFLAVAGSLLAAHTVSAQFSVSSNSGTIRKRNNSGGPGANYSKAIIIHSTDWKSGIATEYNYVRTHFPNCKAINHIREFYTGKTYDIITFTEPSGEKRAVYFNYRQHS